MTKDELYISAMINGIIGGTLLGLGIAFTITELYAFHWAILAMTLGGLGIINSSIRFKQLFKEAKRHNND